MCERTYCRHEHERLCSCPPVTCRDALGMAAHLAENMEQVQWSLTYNSLKDIKPYQLCLVGKCRICGGRLCMEQRPVEADSTDGFLAAVYRHLYHFHRSIGQCLPCAAFRIKFVEMFHKEDRAATPTRDAPIPFRSFLSLRPPMRSLISTIRRKRSWRRCTTAWS